MMEHEFTLVFRLPEVSPRPGDHVDALAECGCTDAVVGIGRHGSIALELACEAPSAFMAVMSAVRDVHAAIPDAELVATEAKFAN